MPRSAAYFGVWLNEPYVQDSVIRALKEAGHPLPLRDLASAAGVYLGQANRVVWRLHKKGLVARYKLPLRRHAFCRKRWECLPGEATRMLYVYSWAGD
jgi:hypothetical protein